MVVTYVVGGFHISCEGEFDRLWSLVNSLANQYWSFEIAWEYCLQPGFKALWWQRGGGAICKWNPLLGWGCCRNSHILKGQQRSTLLPFTRWRQYSAERPPGKSWTEFGVTISLLDSKGTIIIALLKLKSEYERSKRWMLVGIGVGFG